MVKLGLPMMKAKSFFSFSSVFAFTQAKEQILFQVQPFKMSTAESNSEMHLTPRRLTIECEIVYDTTEAEFGMRMTPWRLTL